MPSPLILPYEKAGLFQWKIENTQKLCKVWEANWKIQTNDYCNFFPIWELQKQHVVNNKLWCLVNLNYSSTEKEEFQLCTEKDTREQNL